MSIGGGLNIRQTEQSDTFVNNLASTYLSFAKKLGVTVTDATFGAGFNNSDGGKFAVETTVGGQRYDPGQVKYTDANLALEASRAVFFALKGSELPAYLRKVFDGITPETATQAQIDGTLTYAGTLKQVRAALLETREPLQIVKDDLANTFKELGTNATTFKTDFVAAIDAGITPENLAIWMAAGTALDTITQAAGGIASDPYRELKDRLALLTKEETSRSLELRDAADDTARSILNQIYAQEDLNTSAEELIQTRQKEKQELDALAATHLRLSDQLAILKGTETERSIALRDATDPTTKSLLEQIYAQEDLNAATKNANKAIENVTVSLEEWAKWQKVDASNATEFAAVEEVASIRKEAAENFLQAQQKVLDAQSNLVSVLKSTIKGFEDFLSSLDNADDPTKSLVLARQTFDATADKARTGDEGAIGQLTTTGKNFLDLSKSYSATIQDYKRDVAKVRNIINEGIKAAEKPLKELPAEVTQEKGPITTAVDELAKATLAEAEARYNAIYTLAEIDAAQKTLLARYDKAILAVPYSHELKPYTANVKETTTLLKEFGLSIDMVDGKQVLLNLATGDAANTLENLGLTLKTVDGKQVLLNDKTGVAVDALAALGFRTGSVENKQVFLENITTDTTGKMGGLAAQVSLVDGKLVLLNTAVNQSTNPLKDLGLSVGQVDGKFVLVQDALVDLEKVIPDTLPVIVPPVLPDALTDLADTVPLTFPEITTGAVKTALEALAKLIPTAFPNISSIEVKTALETLAKLIPVGFPPISSGLVKDALEVLAYKIPSVFDPISSNVVVDALTKLAATIPASIAMPDMVAFYAGIKSSVETALINAYTPVAVPVAPVVPTPSVVTPAAPTAPTSPLVPSVPAITTLLGSQGVSFTAGNLTKNWEGTNTTVSASEAASVLNEYGTAWGVDAATARAIELGATEAILVELRKYSQGLPQFDVGTNYIPQDMDVRVHKGEAIIPAAFNNSTFGSSAITESLLNAIAVKLDNLQRVNSNENNAIISNTSKIFTRLDRLSPDGDAFNVRSV